MLGVEHAIAVSSGTDALLLALMALGIGPGDEVVTSTYSFFATAGAIVRVGARPVLVDIDPADVQHRPVTDRGRHHAADQGDHAGASVRPERRSRSDPRRSLAVGRAGHRRRGAGDRRHLQGRGRSAASERFGCFSFFPSKNLGAFGDAGLLTTNDAGLAKRARACCARTAWSRSTTTTLVGGNFRMDALQAAVLRVKAPHLAAWTEARRLNAARYVAHVRATRALTDA